MYLISIRIRIRKDYTKESFASKWESLEIC